MSENNLNSLYKEYAELSAKRITSLLELNNITKSLNEAHDDIEDQDKDGRFGVNISAHAIARVGEHLESLALKHAVIYQDVMKSGSPTESLIWPSNMKIFIIDMLVKAIEKNDFIVKPSQNSNGQEYHYTIEVKKWSNSAHKLNFTGVVESHNVKTGYFNWDPPYPKEF